MAKHIKENYREYIELSTGKKIYANCGIVGISDDLGVYDGYDGNIDSSEGDWFYDLPLETRRKTMLATGFPSENEYISEEEKIELAEYIITLWNKYIEKQKNRLNVLRSKDHEA